MPKMPETSSTAAPLNPTDPTDTGHRRAARLRKEEQERLEAQMFVSDEELNAYITDQDINEKSKVTEAIKHYAAQGDMETAEQVVDLYTQRREKQKSFADDAELTFDEQEHNKELTTSLRRRFGHKNKEGEVRTNKELIDLWSSEQHTLNYNTSALLVDAATVDELAPQKKADYLLQMEMWEKVKGTGEGSQDGLDQTLEIGKALLTDPLTYIGVGTLGIGTVGKAAGKHLTKEALKQSLRESVKQHAKKFGAIGAIEGGTLGALHEGASQTAKLKAKELDVSDNLDWGQVAKVAAVGAVLGGTLAGTLAGAGKAVSGLIEARKIEKGLTNKEIIQEITDVTSEADAVTYYTTKLGMQEDVARRLVEDVQTEGVRFDTKAGTWKTATGEPFEPTFKQEYIDGTAQHLQLQGTQKAIAKQQEVITGKSSKVLEGLNRQVAKSQDTVNTLQKKVDDIKKAEKTGKETHKTATVAARKQVAKSTKALNTILKAEKAAKKAGKKTNKKKSIANAKARVSKAKTELRKVAKAPSKAVQKSNATVALNKAKTALKKAEREIASFNKGTKSATGKQAVKIKAVKDEQKKLKKLEDVAFKEEAELVIKTKRADEVELTTEQRQVLKDNAIDTDTLDKLIEDELILSTLHNVPNRAWREDATVTKSLSKVAHNSHTRGLTLGGDVVTAKAGAKHIGERLRAVFSNKERNLGKVNAKLVQAVKSSGLDDEGVLRVLRDPKGAKNPLEKRVSELWQASKRQQILLLKKNKVITSEQANKFLADIDYMPRVYNFKHLMDKKGSQDFADLLNKAAAREPKAVEGIIRSITGQHTGDISTLLPSNFNGAFVRKLIKANRINSEDSSGVVSSHIERSRKIHGIPEEELDAFMVPVEARLSKFFDDVMLRNELADKFGAENQVVENTLKALERKGDQGKRDAEAVKQYFYTTIGNVTHSKALAAAVDNPMTAKVISKINAFQNLKLFMAAIPNASQAIVYGAVHLSNNTNVLNAIFQSTRMVMKAIVNNKETADIVRRAGVLGEMDMQRLMLENNIGGRIFDKELKGFLGPLDYLNDNTKFLRMVGFHGVESINRRAGALMGEMKAQILHKKLMNPSVFSSPKKRERILKELKELGIENPNKEVLDANDLSNAGYFFNKDINFSGETINMPEKWHGPYGKLLSKFKSFSGYSARFMKRHVADELFKNKNPMPLITLLTVGVPAGLAVENIRNELMNLFNDEEYVEENRDALELTMKGLSQVGAMGLWTDVMSQAGGSTYAQKSLLGPGVGQILDVGTGLGQVAGGDVEKGVKKIAKTLTPPIPGKKTLFPKAERKKKHKFNF